MSGRVHRFVSRGSASVMLYHVSGTHRHGLPYRVSVIIDGVVHRESMHSNRPAAAKVFKRLARIVSGESLYPVPGSGLYQCEHDDCEVVQDDDSECDVLYYGKNDGIYCREHAVLSLIK